MQNHPPGRSSSAPSQYQPSYPLHKVVAAVEPARLDQVATALAAAGLDGDRIEIVTSSDAMPPDSRSVAQACAGSSLAWD